MALNMIVIALIWTIGWWLLLQILYFRALPRSGFWIVLSASVSLSTVGVFGMIGRGTTISTSLMVSSLAAIIPIAVTRGHPEAMLSVDWASRKGYLTDAEKDRADSYGCITVVLIIAVVTVYALVDLIHGRVVGVCSDGVEIPTAW